MIIIGYQGIGKSTLCKENNQIIDLESSNFWIPVTENKDVRTHRTSHGALYRHDDWYAAYCNIANDLSRQGHVVFVSSHKPVRDYLKASEEIVVAIAPAPTAEMETIWLTKLQARYDESGLEKDYKALKNAEERYRENVQEIFDDVPIHVMLHDPRYKLSDVISILTGTPIDWNGSEREYVKYAAAEMSKSPTRITLDKWMTLCK